MTFRNDSGDVLSIDGDFAITKQAASFFNSKIKGDFSITFQVPNTAENRDKLNYNGPQDRTQVAFTRQSWTLQREGNSYIGGYIVIQQDMGDVLNCYFISGNANWMNLLDSLITELDYSGILTPNNYDFVLNKTNYLTLREALTGVVIPFVDWGYEWRKGDNRWFMADIFDSSSDINKTYFELYPCFYLSSLMNEISIQRGVKFQGSVFSDALYKTLAIAPVNGDMKRPSINSTSGVGATQVTSSAVAILYNFTEGSDPEGLFASSVYTANKTSEIRVTVSIISFVPTVSAQVTLEVNGSPHGGYSVGTTLTDKKIFYAFTAVSGDAIRLTYYAIGGGTATLTANIKIEIPTSITVGDLVKVNYFLPELSCFDIVKFIINYFGCVATYNQYSKTVTINQIEKMNIGASADWSDYYVRHSVEYTVDSAKNNYMRIQQADDSQIKAYNRQNKIGYGEGNITTANTLKEENELIKTPFAASPFDLSKNGDWLTSIPLFSLKDSGDPVAYTAIANAGGLAQYTVADSSNCRRQVFRIVDDTSGDLGFFVCQADITSTTMRFFQNYPGATSTGLLYRQEVSKNSVTPRILSVVGSDTVIPFFPYISTSDTQYSAYDENFTADSRTGVALANFCKQTTGLTLDTVKGNCAFDNPESDFVDPTVKQMYFGRIGNMLGNPRINAVFVLPESVFQGFEFQQFIVLKTAKLSGTFFVEKISNYTDSLTEVEVSLYML